MYKELIKDKKAVLFDLDGTLVDSNKLWGQALKNVANNVGLEFFLIEDTPGFTILDKWQNALEKTSKDIKISAKDLAKNTYTEFLDLVKTQGIDTILGFWKLGVELKIEKKLKLGIVTNSPRDVAKQVIEHLKLTDVFDIVIGVDDVKRQKPDPQMYLLAAKKLGVKPKEVLVFEDSVVGAIAADRAKMDVVVIWDGTVSENRYPKDVRGFISDFTPLPGNLDSTLKEEVMRVAKENKNWSKDSNLNQETEK